MATFAFYNIGLANKEITRLSARVAELESAQPKDQSESLKDALASNELAASALAASEAALAATKLDLSAKSTAFDQLNTAFNTLNTELNQACLAAKLELPETATPSEKLSALQGAVNAAIAKTGVKIAELPAPGDSSSKAKDFSHLTGLDRAIAANQAKHAAHKNP